ncbi:hypothetical protein BN1723_012947, partial [Verticillium longisporum]
MAYNRPLYVRNGYSDVPVATPTVSARGYGHAQRSPASNNLLPQPQNLSQAHASAPDMPQLGATFVPSGFDDYYMPEVVAPSPQRITPQVPQNMQDDLQRMELGAREAPRPANDDNSPSSLYS